MLDSNAQKTPATSISLYDNPALTDVINGAITASSEVNIESIVDKFIDAFP